MEQPREAEPRLSAFFDSLLCQYRLTVDIETPHPRPNARPVIRNGVCGACSTLERRPVVCRCRDLVRHQAPAPHERIVEIAVPAARTPNFTADIARERLGGAAAPRFQRSRERGLLP